MTVISKYRPSDPTYPLLQLGLDTTGKLKAIMSQDIDATNQLTDTSTSALVQNTWYYLVYSFEMTGGNETIYSFWLNNVADGTNTHTIFLVDDALFETFIAITKTSSTPTWSNLFNGYIYDFHITQANHAAGTDYIETSGCPTGCSECPKGATSACPWTFDYDYFDDSGVAVPCDTSTCTDRSCVREDECQPTSECDTGFDYCHLCADRECTRCTEYTGCDNGFCLATTWASNDTVDCVCNLGYGRRSQQNKCRGCYPRCQLCDDIFDDYSVCRECKPGNFEIQPTVVTYKYCVDTCPTGFTEGTAPSCDAPATSADALIIHYEFDIPNDTFENAGSAGSTFDVAATRDAPSGQPAKYRGLYFSSSNDAYVSIDNIILTHTISVHSWALIQTVADMTLFSKDRNAFVKTTDRLHIRLYIDSLGAMAAGLAYEEDPSVYQSTSSTGTIATNTWYYLVYSLENVNGKDTNTRYIINNTEDSVATITPIFIIDRSEYTAFVGIQRDGTGSWANQWNGFIYNIMIYQESYAGSGNTHYKTSSCASGCSTCPASLTCPWTAAFDHYDSPAVACALPSCDWRSCVRTQDCQITCDADGGSRYCHLCYDRECMTCDDYTSTGCTMCNWSSHSTLTTGACDCDDGWGRSGVNFPCLECHTNCKECNEGNRDDYYDCT